MNGILAPGCTCHKAELCWLENVLSLTRGVSVCLSQQISVSQIKADKVQIIGVNCSFAVCLDQDEQKILQSVTR